MKRYFVMRGQFSNVYALRFAETEAQVAKALKLGYEGITYKEAEAMARRERERRKYEPQSSGYADAEIRPFDD